MKMVREEQRESREKKHTSVVEANGVPLLIKYHVLFLKAYFHRSTYNVFPSFKINKMI